MRLPHVKHWIKLAPQPLSILAILPASPPPHCHCVTTGVPFHARQALNFYCLSITFLHVCEFPLSPWRTLGPLLGRARLSRGPSLQFAIVCHHLFSLTTECRLHPPPPPPPNPIWSESHVGPTWDLCFSWLLLKYCIMHLCSAGRLK